MISIKWTTRPAQLVAKGEQVSEIKWRDTGSVQALANDQIEFGAKEWNSDQTPTTSRTKSGRAKSADPVTACGTENANSAISPQKKIPKSEWPDNATISILVSHNPKKRTAAARFAQYKDGMTVADYKAAVGAKQAILDLRWDIKMNFIKVTP